jgi:MoxR-like ATPase
MPYAPKLFKPPAGAPPSNDPYVFSDRTLIAVDVALAAGRPLLITGNPGSGKTTLAKAVGARLNWRFLSRTVTSRTRLEDLQADVDTLRRLADAQLGPEEGLPPDWTYLRPGVLWWAFNRAGAQKRGATDAEIEAVKEKYRPLDDLRDPSEGNKASEDVVVLLDEIDKADPDLPNDLLEPLDRRRFASPLLERPAVEAAPSLKVMLMVTTNGERDMPPAFVRRCVVLDLPDARGRTDAQPPQPGEITLETIATSHFGDGGNLPAIYEDVAKVVETMRSEAARRGLRPPSTAEYLDTVRALKAVPAFQQGAVWSEVQNLLLLKAPPARGAP